MTAIYDRWLELYCFWLELNYCGLAQPLRHNATSPVLRIRSGRNSIFSLWACRCQIARFSFAFASTALQIRIPQIYKMIQKRGNSSGNRVSPIFNRQTDSSSSPGFTFLQADSFLHNPDKAQPLTGNVKSFLQSLFFPIRPLHAKLIPFLDSIFSLESPLHIL